MLVGISPRSRTRVQHFLPHHIWRFPPVPGPNSSRNMADPQRDARDVRRPEPSSLVVGLDLRSAGATMLRLPRKSSHYALSHSVAQRYCTVHYFQYKYNALVHSIRIKRAKKSIINQCPTQRNMQVLVNESGSASRYTIIVRVYYCSL